MQNVARHRRHVPHLLAAGLLRPTLQLLSQPLHEAQEASLRALTNLTRHEASTIHVVAAGALPQLVRYLSSPEAGLAKDAAAVILNISLHGPNVAKVLEAGALQPLIRAMRSSATDRSTLDLIARTMHAITDEASARAQVASAGGMPPLVELMADVEIDIAGSAASAICNLVSQPDLAERAASAGAVPPLARLLHHSAEWAVQNAAAAVSGMCQTAAVKSKFVSAGCLPRLVQLLSHANDDIKCHAARALNNIADITDTPAGQPIFTPAVLAAGAMQPLARLLDSESHHVSSIAACSMLTFAENPASRRLVADSGAFPSLARLLRSPEQDVQIYTTGVMRHLTLDESGLSLIRSGGVLDRLRELTASADPLIKAEAELALQNINAAPRSATCSIYLILAIDYRSSS